MPSKLSWPLRVVIAVLFFISVATSLYLGQTLAENSKKAWFNEANMAAEKATDTCLSWLSLQETQFRAIAAVFYGSKRVTSDEFLDVLELIEVPNTLPLHSVFFVERDIEKDDQFLITMNSNNNIAQSFSDQNLRQKSILDGIAAATSFPDEIVIGPLYEDKRGMPFLSFITNASNDPVDGFLVATINFEELISDLLTLHVSNGLLLRSIEINSMADKPFAGIYKLTGEKQQNIEVHNFETHVDSGKANLVFSWSLTPEFSGGANVGMGRMIQIVGCLLSFLFLNIVLLLLKENTRVNQRVTERTHELSVAIETVKQEIVEKTTAERALRESSERLKALSDASFEAILLTEDGYCVDLNNTAERMFGYSRQEAIGVYAPQIFSPEYAEIILDNIKYGNETPYEVVCLTKENKQFPAMLQGRSIDLENRVLRVTVIRDLSEQRDAELKQLESEKRYRSLINDTKTGFLVVDFKGNVLEANDEYAKIIGYSSSNEIIGENVAGWTAHYDKEKNVRAIEDCILQGHCSNLIIDYLAMGNVTIPVEINASVIKQNDKKVIMALVRNISYQKELEAEQLKTKKLESVGVLAGGIAHDFNNILVAILGSLSLAKHSLENKEDKCFSLIKQAEKASLRAKDLTQQLLTFSKGGDPVKKVAPLDSLIKDSANFVLHGSRVVCNYDIPADLWAVRIDSGQISQVIQNLAVNAKQAMDSQGQLNISCRNLDGNVQILSEGLIEKQYIQISIEDNGCGIAQENVSKIFDPYFSTKSNGSGLGLALSHSIIAKHNGRFSVSSELGHGTTFTILLPAKLTDNKVEEESNISMEVGTGKILLMDDDEVVRAVAKEMLIHLGYQVLEAEDGEETIKKYKKSLANEPIDFVIMDLTIPDGMGGKEAAEELLKINKDVKLIVSSGYSNDPIMASFDEYGFVAAISKPFDLETLSKVLRSI